MTALVVDKKKKREDILLSAIQSFASKGFSKTTINDIAKTANIGKGTVYEYFKSKDEIIHHAFLYFTSSMMGGFEDILTSDNNAKEKFIEMLNAFCHITDGKSGELLDIMMDFWAEGLRSDNAKSILHEDMRQMYISYRHLIKTIINQGIKEKCFKDTVDSDSLATAIIGMLDGLLVQWILDRDEINISKIIDSFIEMILKGIENG